MTISRFETNDVEKTENINNGISTQLYSSTNGNLPEAEKEFVPEQLIVKLRPGAEPSEVKNLQDKLNASMINSTQTLGIELWEIQGISVPEAITTYGRDPAVEYIEPNTTVFTTQTIPNDPSFDQLWGLNNTGQTGGIPDADIDAPEAWEIQTGNDVVIGVIDTGVDYTHPDLQNNMWTNPGEIPDNGLDDDGNGFVDDFYGYDFVNNDGDPFDDNDHGTHVSGTIAAEGNNDIGVTGVNWDAQIMSIKFLDEFGSGTTFNAIQAVEYSTMMGVDLTNNSWGGGGFSQGLSDAIAAAGDAGQLFIAAAGNGSSDTDLFPFYPASYDLDNIISVAATTDADQLAGFSNFGATSVDLGAPGQGILSTVPGNNYAVFDGTSMAAPHVSGVAGLLLSEFPGLSAQEVKERILETTDLIPALEGITVSQGRLNAFNALFAPNAGGIEGSKWNDLDQDGIQDGDEPVLEDWTIYLDQNQNGELDEDEAFTVTDAEGNYAFNFLEAGTYTVAEVVKPGWLPTFPESGSQTVTFGEGEIVTGIDFGNYLANPAEVSGVKWNDLNEDGVKDEDEPSLEGWTIYLDQNNNGQLDEGELSTATDPNGEYLFTNLEPSIYTIAEELKPGWEQTFPELGLIEELYQADFSDANGDPSLDGFTIDNTGAPVEGLWHLSIGRGEQPGHSADDSMYFGQGEGPDGGGNYDVGYTAGRITSPEIDLTAVSGAELSFNYFLEAEGGPPWDEAQVLISQDGGAFQQIASKNNGDLVNGTPEWTNATFDLTPYVGSTIQVQFDFDTLDDIANDFEGWYVDDVTVNSIGTGAHVVDLAPGDAVTDLNFGNFELEPGSISGSKWNDLDGDGERGEGEPGLEGWTIYLDQNQNGELDEEDISTVTDANGDYSFTELPVDTYTVAEVLQEGWQQTFPGGGTGTGALVFQDSLPWDSDALQQVLENNDLETEVVNSSEMDNIDLSSYEVVFISNDQPQSFYNNYVANASNFADYVSSGGTLWFGAASLGFNGGDFGGGQLPNGVTVSNFFEDFNDVVAPTNPLMTGVPDPFFGTAASHAAFENLPEDTEIIAQGQNSNLPTLLEYEYGAGQVLAFGQTLEYGFANEQDAGLILENSVPYAFEIAGGTYTVELEPGEAVTDIDFGNQEILPGEIQGSKWNDLNGNGERDEDEPGLEGWTIYIDENQNGELDEGEVSTITDANGDYTFIGIEPGTYTVTEIVQEDWQPTFPVTFEYESTDSNDPEGPIFDWVDISDVGTELNLFDDDFATLDLPFTFPFFEQEQNTVNISSNGYLAFDSEAFDYTNDPIPDPQQPNNLVAPFWDDLNPAQGGSIYYYYDEAEEQFIVQYQDIPRYFDEGSLTFEVILEPDGSILYQYEEMNGTLDSATIGVENVNGTDGLQVAFNESYVEDDLAVSIEPVPGSLQPYTVVVGSGEIVTGIDFGNFNPSPEPEPPVFGTPGDDEINLFDGGVVVFAGDGNDIVDASQSSGNNQLFGGKGDDELFASNNDRLFGEAGNDILNAISGTGNNRLFGGKGNDVLFAGASDRLFGGDGNDQLFAGEGDSLLSGGQGADQFWIANADLPSSTNTITNFELDVDVLGIGGLGLDFDDLSLIQQGDDALIAALDTNLAILTGIQASDLDSDNFVLT
ncbi:MAG: S8 family serine peptidase [Cyanobacteria bacterium]|jgi:subtilisin family serine protease|nr:S8 family serine peptidase [Cyanobacteria bacterium GSL.Bin1]